jgi:hypothetical protein
MKPDQMFFVFDCESVGLHGQTFAVAGGIYDIHGEAVEGSEFVFACDPHPGMAVKNREAEDMEWVDAKVTVREGVTPCATPDEVRHRFWALWGMARNANPGILMFVECGWPVEARFLLECIADDPLSRNWKGPYPMHEIATMMLAAGMDPMATYERREDELPAHEPLADARLSARLLAVALNRLDEASGVCESYAGSPDILKIED